jgi:putative transposase
MQAFKFRIETSRAVKAKLERTLDLCRELYNGALQERRDACRMNGVSLNYNDQSAQLPEVKAVRPDVADVYSQVLQDVLKRVQKGFDGFFRRIKAGEKASYPRFKGKGRYDSFTYPGTGWSLEGHTLTLSKIGSMRVRMSRPIEGNIKTVQIKREGDGWFVIFTCEVPNVPPATPEAPKMIGIDVGLESFYTDSTGQQIGNPKHYRKAEAKLKRATAPPVAQEKRLGQPPPRAGESGQTAPQSRHPEKRFSA